MSIVSSVDGSSGVGYSNRADKEKESGDLFQEIFLRNLEEQKKEISSANFTSENKFARAGVIWDSSNNVSVNFTDANGERTEVALSKANLARLQEKFPGSIKGDERNVLAEGEARDYLATMWQDFYEVQWVRKADENGDGTLSVEEQLNVRSFADAKAVNHHSANELFRNDDSLKEQFASELKEIAIDEAFDHYIGVDKDLDLKISMSEALDNGIYVSDYDSLVEFDNSMVEAKKGSRNSPVSLERLETNIRKEFDLSLDLKLQIRNSLLDILFESSDVALNKQRFSLVDALKLRS